MPVRTNGGVFTDQMLTGSLRHFVILGADFSGSIDENGKSVVGSAAEIVYAEISKRATVVIINPSTDDNNGMSFALETNRAAWSAETLEIVIRSLGTVGVDNTDLSSVTVEEVAYDFLETIEPGAVSSVFGRIGNVVATEGDYSIDQMADVDITTVIPGKNSYLQFDVDSGQWVPNASPDGVTGPSLYVDAVFGDDINGTGDLRSPFKSIGKVMTFIGNGSSQADYRQVWNIEIASGVYDENITIPKFRTLSLKSTGFVSIGDPASGVAGNIQMDHSEITDPSVIGGISFGQTNVTVLSNFRSTSSSGSWRIKGDFIYDTGTQLVSNNGILLFSMIGTTLGGTVRQTGLNSPANVHTTIFNSDIGAIDFENLKLLRLDDTTVNNDSTVGTIERLVNAQIMGDFIITSGLDTTYNRLPTGFYMTTFRGDLVFPPGSDGILVDAYTFDEMRYRGAVEDFTINGGTVREAFDRGDIVVASSITLDRLMDTNLVDTPPEIGQVLQYDGSKWAAQDEAGTVQLVDGVFWETPPTVNKNLTNSGKRVNSVVSEWSVVTADLSQNKTPDVATKVYFELSVGVATGNLVEVGVYEPENVSGLEVQPSVTTGFHSINFTDNSIYTNGAFLMEFTSFTLDTAIQPSIVQFALDKDTGQLWVGYNGVWEGNADPSTGTGETGIAVVDPRNSFCSPNSVNAWVESETASQFTAPAGFVNLASSQAIRGRLEDLDNVTVVAPTNTQFLGYNIADAEWNNKDISYNDLADKIGVDGLADGSIDQPSLTTDQILGWDGVNWTNTDYPSINKLSDVDVSGLQDSYILSWNQSEGQWRPVVDQALTPTMPPTAFYASSFDNPNNNDWQIDAFASIETDPQNSALLVRAFDDTAIEGVGLTMPVNVGATMANLTFTGRKLTATASNVVLRVYIREIVYNSAVGNWEQLTDVTINLPTGTDFQRQSFAIDITSGVVMNPGSTYQCEIVRESTSLSDTLSGDFLLLELQLGYS